MNKQHDISAFIRIAAGIRGLHGYPTQGDFIQAKENDCKRQADSIIEQWKRYEKAVARIHIIDSLCGLLLSTLWGSIASGATLISIPTEVVREPKVKLDLTNQVALARRALCASPLCIKSLNASLNDLLHAIEIAAALQAFDLEKALEIKNASMTNMLWKPEDIPLIQGKLNEGVLTARWLSNGLVLIRNKSDETYLPPFYKEPNYQDLL